MNSADLSAGRGRADDRNDWTSTLTTTGLIFLAGMLGYMLAGWADVRKEQLVREAIAMQFFQAKVLKPGLEEHVELARTTMSQLKDRMAEIEKASDKKAESQEDNSKTDLKATWKGAKEEVSHMGEILGSIERNYALSPQEQAAIMRMVLAGQNSSVRDPRREGKSGGADDSAPPKKSSKGMLEGTPDKKSKESKSSEGKSSDGKSTEGKPAAKSQESPAGEKPADKSSPKPTDK
ncbi:MAG: hypothetical protein NT069_32300 [Planctomycetota bacterium]|nr:hypothetical protein [Planctomycetota bacterium]